MLPACHPAGSDRVRFRKENGMALLESVLASKKAEGPPKPIPSPYLAPISFPRMLGGPAVRREPN